MEPRFKKVLIIGINGGLAQITAKLIKKLNPTIKVLGVDNRPVNQIKPILGVDLKKFATPEMSLSDYLEIISLMPFIT